MVIRLVVVLVGLGMALMAGCTVSGPTRAGETTGSSGTASADRGGETRMGGQGGWAVAIHGGAGYISPDVPADRRRVIVASMEGVLRLAAERLERGDSAVDVVEEVVARLEDNRLFNAGRGAVFTAEGRNEHDASIMVGRDAGVGEVASTVVGRGGAVAGVRTVKNPIRLARRVMEDTDHVLLAGDGAERFADVAGVERVDPFWFFTEDRWAALERVLKERGDEVPSRPNRRGTTGPISMLGDGGDDLDMDGIDADGLLMFGTVGCVVLDRSGTLASATSTGGLTGKRWGRVGDSPILGAGTYAANGFAAVSGTGTGEEYIKRAIAYDVVAQMKYGRRTLEEAARDQIFGRIEPDVGGLIAVGADGSIAMYTNTGSMPRAAADSRGRFEVLIWENPERLDGADGS